MLMAIIGDHLPNYYNIGINYNMEILLNNTHIITIKINSLVFLLNEELILELIIQKYEYDAISN